MPMKTVSFDLKTKLPASRRELIIRLFWSLLMAIVLAVFHFVGFFVWLVQFASILLRGRRSDTLQNFMVAYARYEARYSAYACMATDERPPIIPE